MLDGPGVRQLAILIVYLDDLLIAYPNLVEQKHHMVAVFNCLKKFFLAVNLAKYMFAYELPHLADS